VFAGPRPGSLGSTLHTTPGVSIACAALACEGPSGAAAQHRLCTGPALTSLPHAIVASSAIRTHSASKIPP